MGRLHLQGNRTGKKTLTTTSEGGQDAAHDSIHVTIVWTRSH